MRSFFNVWKCNILTQNPPIWLVHCHRIFPRYSTPYGAYVMQLVLADCVGRHGHLGQCLSYYAQELQVQGHSFLCSFFFSNATDNSILNKNWVSTCIRPNKEIKTQYGHSSNLQLHRTQGWYRWWQPTRNSRREVCKSGTWSYGLPDNKQIRARQDDISDDTQHRRNESTDQKVTRQEDSTRS
jgi:hypothetical protein